MTFVDFLNQYGYYILCGLVLIVDVLAIILKKRSKVQIIDDSATSELLDLVIKAEKEFGAGNGEKKLSSVINSFIASHPSLAPYSDVIISLVEKILKSPQRKELDNEKKNVKA